jgi:hypothetical protein
MIASLRLLLSVLLVTAGVVGAGVAQPKWWQSWQLRAGRRSGMLISEPAEQNRVVLERIKARSSVIARLRMGELTLFEAAAWFRQINSEPANYPDRNWEKMPGDSVNEKVCRHVITWVCGQMSDQAPESEVKMVEWRLEEELDCHLATHGRVVLPDWE